MLIFEEWNIDGEKKETSPNPIKFKNFGTISSFAKVHLNLIVYFYRSKAELESK